MCNFVDPEQYQNESIYAFTEKEILGLPGPLMSEACHRLFKWRIPLFSSPSVIILSHIHLLVLHRGSLIVYNFLMLYWLFQLKEKGGEDFEEKKRKK